MCVYADSVLCVGQVKDLSGTTERWKGQVEDLKNYSSYQYAVGIDGEPFEFEWNPGFLSLSLLREIENDLETKNIPPEDFKDWIIFMSVFNDMSGIMMRIVSGSPKSLARTLDVSGPGSEEKWYGDSHDQHRQ